MSLHLLAPSPEPVPSGYTTPDGPPTHRCPDAPRGIQRHRPYNSPRRGPPRAETPHRSHSQAPETSVPRRIRPAPAIFALAVFTSLAFAEAATQGHHRREAAQGGRELIDLDSTAVELERRLGEVFPGVGSRRSSVSSEPQSPQGVNRVVMHDPEAWGTRAIEQDPDPENPSTPPPPPYGTEPAQREPDGDPMTAHSIRS